MYRNLFRFAVLSCFLSGLCFAQTTPQIDDPQLYRGALDMFSRMYQDSLSADTPENGTALRTAAAQIFGITSSDFSYLVAVTASFRAQPASLPGAGGSPEASIPLTDQINQLSHSLSASGWTHFRAFVNGDFREHTHILSVGAPNEVTGGVK